jgi:FSR family fosmidomycin resistance protein-like MFS transporter
VTRMTFRSRQPALTGAAVLAAALAVELVDELVDGTKGAAFPLIRHDLALTYGQIGLLASVPLLLGSLLELPLGVLAGYGRRQRIAVLAGGLAFIGSLIAAAVAHSFAALLIAFVAFFPASGAFVSLTQSGLMDADPARQEQHMARWNLAGSTGAVAGPVLLIAVLAPGGGWRAAYLVLACCAALAWLGVARHGPRPALAQGQAQAQGHAAGPAADESRAAAGGSSTTAGSTAAGSTTAGSTTAGSGDPGLKDRPGAADPGDPHRGGAARRVRRALRQPGVVRWLVLLEVADLLLDVLTGFLAIYLVDVVHATPAEAAAGVAVRLVADLAGDAALVGVLERTSGRRVLTASAAAAAVLYPAFLLVPGFWPKLIVLAGLSIATAPWYPVLQANLYGSLPGESGVAVTLTSAASLAGGIGPLAAGFLAERFGLAWALAVLALAPACLLTGLRRRRDSGRYREAGGLP